MSKATETLNAIKIALGLESSSNEVKLATMKLDDKVTVLESESFEAGQSVVIVTEDDQKIALPIGEYTMEDGAKLFVEEEGIIASYGEKEEEKEEESTEEAPKEEEVEASTESTETRTPKKVVEAVTKESYFSTESVLEAVAELVEAKLEEFKASLVEDVKAVEEVKEETTEETTEEATEATEMSAEEVTEEVKEEEVKEEEVELASAKPIVHNPKTESNFSVKGGSLLDFLNNRK